MLKNRSPFGIHSPNTSQGAHTVHPADPMLNYRVWRVLASSLWNAEHGTSSAHLIESGGVRTAG